MKRLLSLFILVFCMAALMTGCLFESSDDDNDADDTPESIHDLTIGGGVFIVNPEIYGSHAQIATFFGQYPYEDAEVYVNAHKLTADSGIHSNAAPLVNDDLTAEDAIRIVVYALGDSVVHQLPVPELPDIIEPTADSSHSLEDSLRVHIAYPGDHDYIAFLLSNQTDVAYGVETSQSDLRTAVPPAMLTAEGSSLLTAYSVNTNGDIPEHFNIENQFQVLLTASVQIVPLDFHR